MGTALTEIRLKYRTLRTWETALPVSPPPTVVRPHQYHGGRTSGRLSSGGRLRLPDAKGGGSAYPAGLGEVVETAHQEEPVRRGHAGVRGDPAARHGASSASAEPLSATTTEWRRPTGSAARTAGRASSSFSAGMRTAVRVSMRLQSGCPRSGRPPWDGQDTTPSRDMSI